MTEDHRFWSVTDDDWIELQDLDTSDVLLTPDGATVTVDFLGWDAGVTTDAYDLTVDQEHNFFVTADTTGEPVLVHNQTQGFFCGVPVDADLADDLLDLNRRLDASGDAGQVGTALTRLGDDLAEQGVERILEYVEIGSVVVGGTVLIVTSGGSAAPGVLFAIGATAGAGVVALDVVDGNWRSAGLNGVFVVFDLKGAAVAARPLLQNGGEELINRTSAIQNSLSSFRRASSSFNSAIANEQLVQAANSAGFTDAAEDFSLRADSVVSSAPGLM